MKQQAIRAKLAAAHADGALDPALLLLVEAQSAAAPIGAQILAHDLEEHRPPAAPPPRGGLVGELSALPAVIQNAAIQALARRKWRGLAPGLTRLDLDVGGNGLTRLLRISPRSAIPRHTHEGTEYALVLSGGLADGVGDYGPGDISFADATVTHTPRARSGQACWLLVVRYGGLKATGALGFIQRLICRPAR
jgi:putative transcriptional regulator